MNLKAKTLQIAKTQPKGSPLRKTLLAAVTNKPAVRMFPTTGIFSLWLRTSVLSGLSMVILTDRTSDARSARDANDEVIKECYRAVLAGLNVVYNNHRDRR